MAIRFQNSLQRRDAAESRFQQIGEQKYDIAQESRISQNGTSGQMPGAEENRATSRMTSVPVWSFCIDFSIFGTIPRQLVAATVTFVSFSGWLRSLIEDQCLSGSWTLQILWQHRRPYIEQVIFNTLALEDYAMHT
eukprot:2057120-Amphidinium_carterae.1